MAEHQVLILVVVGSNPASPAKNKLRGVLQPQGQLGFPGSNQPFTAPLGPLTPRRNEDA